MLDHEDWLICVCVYMVKIISLCKNSMENDTVIIVLQLLYKHNN